MAMTREDLGLDEEQPAIVGLGNLVGRAHAPGLAHVGRAIEHPAVDEDFERADANPVVTDARGSVGLAGHLVARQLIELGDDRFAVAEGWAQHARGVHPNGELTPVAQPAIKMSVPPRWRNDRRCW